MSGDLRFRRDLYKGTAEYYDRFRPPYPAVLLDDLRARVPLDGASSVLDLACGTGQIAFALADDVAEVWAVDQEAESVGFGARKAQRLGVTGIHWIAATAENVAFERAFDLVAIGNAFHRLDRDVVAKRVVRLLPEGGCLALLWSDTPMSGDEPWQAAMRETFERWMSAVGARNRLPAGWEQLMARVPHEQVLRRAGLTYEGKFDFSVVKKWSVESLIGFVYSTSLLNRRALGDHAEAFENDLQKQILRCCPGGVCEQDLTSAYELARRTA